MKKYLKFFSLILIIIAITVLFINKDKIDVFAKTRNITDVREGDVFKLGDIIPFNDTVNPCRINPESNYYTCTNYSIVYIDYYKDSSSKKPLDSKRYNYIYATGEDSTYTNITIDNNYSEYWKLESIYYSYCSGWVSYKLVPVEYKEPTFTLDCNPTEIKPGETSICSLNMTYYNTYSKVDFKLDTSDFNISNVQINESFENLSDNEDSYSIKPLNELVESDEGTEMPIMTFEIKSEEEKGINVENNIKTIVSIHDEYGDGKEETEISSTVKQATPPDEPIDEPIDENPKTGNTITTILLIILLSLLLGTGIFIVVYRYKNIEL